MQPVNQHLEMQPVNQHLEMQPVNQRLLKFTVTIDLLKTVCYSRAHLIIPLNSRVSRRCKKFENICKKDVDGENAIT